MERYLLHTIKTGLKTIRRVMREKERDEVCMLKVKSFLKVSFKKTIYHFNGQILTCIKGKEP